MKLTPSTILTPRGHGGRGAARQAGIALPVMLFMMTIMLVTSLYLMRSSSTSTMISGNLAYDAALSKSADLGLLTGFQFLKTTAISNKALLNDSIPASGYVATLDTTLAPSASAFWTGSVTLSTPSANGAVDRIEYVIHRMCAAAKPYDDATNKCMQTAPNTAVLNNPVALGASLASDATPLAGAPQVHYVITARIFGPRGGNVINQMVVMIGA